MVKTKQQLVASRALSYPGVNGRKYITIHETANHNAGADAQTHANLQSNGFSASWHWQVDDKEAIQSFPHSVRCWHSGDGTGKGNYESIGIEICVNSDGDFKQAVRNAAELVKKIMKEEGIPQSNVVQHNRWSGKNCPTNLRNGSKGVNWSDFNKMIGESTYTPPKTETKPETITKPSKPSSSIVDYMNAKGMDASYSNRAKLAEEYGIKGYNGSASENTKLLAKIKDGKPSKPTKKGDMKTSSIVTYLNSIDVNSSYSNRAKLAAKYGIKGYKGSANQNTHLLDRLRGDAISDPKPKKQTVHLPKSAATWRTYKTNVQPVSKNSDWSLTPSTFGGLTYEIIGKPYTDVVTIKTSRGNRNIYVAKSTGARIK